MNSKRISAKATVSVAIKVKTNKSYEVFDKVNCNHIETLRESHDTYAVYDHLEEHVKVQGEILAHTDVHSILGTDGSVCVKDVKVLPGKAVIKGILNLYVLFSAAEDPKKIENTSTAIPFTQVIELSSENGEGVRVDVIAAVQSIKTDVEADPEGRNRLISVSATVQTEGELFNIERSDILVDAYSNLYPLEQEQVELALEELTESSAAEEMLQFNLELDSLEYQPLQILAKPYVQKVCGKENELIIEGALDVSAFLSNGEKYRNFEKTFSFTMRKRLSHIGEGMRCEINPCIISTEWMTNTNDGSLKVELQCSIRIYEKKIHRAISGIIVDEEHPLECTGRSSLIIYFGEKGERIWDIARRYHTSSKRIKEINNVSVETLSEKQLLLIS